ncbi:oligopeptide transport system permease protein [Oribacterium sp. KHPX15]|uniref:ABC transporter permease n=1 Tax=Oribacterium sp. KHPX15 TaxID=1855342 RepID=UPI000896F06A|nr:ABC transporter permease [Oribacterium sp. KHPX15]SDZ89241.1 oligopeptide transport system permease protein [Oribacterium sp. KHPX15]
MSENKVKNPLSLQLNVDDFAPASTEEKQSLNVMRESVSFFKDGIQRFRRNKIAMTALTIVLIIMFFCYIVPMFYPYGYEEQIKGSERLAPMAFSKMEQQKIAAGENIFPHLLGTDQNGRDYMIRVLVGGRVSMTVGIVASVLILFIGSIYGAIAGYFGGMVDMIMMRIVDIIYTVPDVLIIILLAQTLKFPLEKLGAAPGFGWIEKLGPNMISMFIVFALLYWVGMARIVRSQIMVLKQSEYVTAAKALGADDKRIIGKHLITNCLGTLIVTTTLQIPSSIFTESFLSFLGLGVQAPMPSLGSLASAALNGFQTYPEKLFAPAALIFIIILSFNLLGDGLRDAFDPKMKQK